MEIVGACSLVEQPQACLVSRNRKALHWGAVCSSGPQTPDFPVVRSIPRRLSMGALARRSKICCSKCAHEQDVMLKRLAKAQRSSTRARGNIAKRGAPGGGLFKLKQ